MLQKIENGRENLLLYGKKALVKRGYGGVSIPELTARCGMATGTFYNYFKSKDALVNQIVSDDWAVLLKKVGKQMEKPGRAFENTRFLYERLAEFQRRYRFFATGAVVKNETVIRSERFDIQKLYDMMREKFAREVEAGALEIGTTPENAAYMLVQTCMVAGRNPDMQFDDLWQFLHMRERALPPEAEERSPGPIAKPTDPEAPYRAPAEAIQNTCGKV